MNEPLLVTQKLLRDVGNLRTRRAVAKIVAGIAHARQRFGVRIVEYSIQSDYLHLIVEAQGTESLATAMKGSPSASLVRSIASWAARTGVRRPLPPPIADQSPPERAEYPRQHRGVGNAPHRSTAVDRSSEP